MRTIHGLLYVLAMSAEIVRGITALHVDTVHAQGARIALWLELGSQTIITTAKGPMIISFDPNRTMCPGGHR